LLGIAGAKQSDIYLYIFSNDQTFVFTNYVLYIEKNSGQNMILNSAPSQNCDLCFGEKKALDRCIGLFVLVCGSASLIFYQEGDICLSELSHHILCFLNFKL
jgi:hypothetical protein